MARHFTTLLAAAAADPDLPVSALPLLNPRERHTAPPTTGNGTPPPTPRPPVHDLFEAQAARTPTATAVIDGHTTPHLRPARPPRQPLAHHLTRHGVDPEVTVGVCLPRSPELIIALLAILKAGGAYLPLDPTHPPERHAFILTDTAAPVVLTEHHLAQRLGPTHGRHLYLDEVSGERKRAALMGSGPDGSARRATYPPRRGPQRSTSPTSPAWARVHPRFWSTTAPCRCR